MQNIFDEKLNDKALTVLADMENKIASLNS